LQYTKIVAPVSGMVSRKTVEVGQVIQPGSRYWPWCRWKTPGSPQISRNATQPYASGPTRHHLGGRLGREYRGRVESVAAATGARFSVLPPENASGNYVKVVQRGP